MIGHEDPRTIHVSLVDESLLSVSRKPIHIDIGQEKELVSRYGDAHDAMKRSYSSEEELASAYFEMIRRVFLIDRYHLPFLFLFKGRHLIKFSPVHMEDARRKYLPMRALASEASRLGVDSVILVSGVWRVGSQHLLPYQLPRDSDQREEALVLRLASKKGDSVEYSAMIGRQGEEVTLNGTRIERGGAPFILAPFYAVWGREIPKEWIKVAEQVLGPLPDNKKYAYPLSTG